MKVILTAVAVVVIAGCLFGQAPAQPAPTQPTTTPPSPGAEAAVYEAVARYQISTWKLGAHTYCFRVKGQDANKDFLDRLKPLPVKPESACVQKRSPNVYTTSIIDKRTKKTAVMFGLGVAYWISPTEAAVDGSYMCGSQCMQGGLYHLVLDNGQWKVTKFEVRISE